MTTEQGDIIRSICDSYRAAVDARDIESFMRLYDPQVRVFDAWGVWSYEGVAQWRKPVEAWFAMDPNQRIQVTFDEVKTHGGAGWCAMSAVVSYASLSAEGKRLRSMQNRLSWVIEASAGEARIVHEHTSAPIGFEDMKAMLTHPTWVGA